ncbi:CDF metal transporter [Salix suchowensis]|nr:CDF metal transporter [Salix suchowensis]
MDSNRWPVGGARLETIGNIVYGAWLLSVTESSIVIVLQDSCTCSVLGKLLPLQYSTNSMGSVNLVVIVESARSLITKTNDDLQEFHIPSIIAVAAALDFRLLSTPQLTLWTTDVSTNRLGPNGCYYRESSQPWTQVVLYLTASHAQIALGVIISWGRTIYSEFSLLAGRSAPHEFLQLLIYKVATFSEEIIQVTPSGRIMSVPTCSNTTLELTHAFLERTGDYLNVLFATARKLMMFIGLLRRSGYSIGLTTPLWKAHDVGQDLQDKLEVLPNVERAFVHVDYETTHYPCTALHLLPGFRFLLPSTTTGIC